MQRNYAVAAFGNYAAMQQCSYAERGTFIGNTNIFFMPFTRVELVPPTWKAGILPIEIKGLINFMSFFRSPEAHVASICVPIRGVANAPLILSDKMRIVRAHHSCGLAALWPCGIVALRPCGLKGLRPCDIMGLWACGLAALQACGLADFRTSESNTDLKGNSSQLWLLLFLLP